MKTTLRIWLVKKGLMTCPDDYTAILESRGALDFDQIINKVYEYGPSYRRETIEAIISQYHRVTTDLLRQGYRLNTGQLCMKPVVRGRTKGMWKQKRNCVFASISPSPSLRAAMSEIEVKVAGKLPSPTVIHGVINYRTRLRNNELTIGYNFGIEGRRIKIVGDAPEVGIYFVSVETGEEIKLPAGYLADNQPKRILGIIPADMPEGAYRLKIITQYSSNSTSKALHEAQLAFPISIMADLPTASKVPTP